MNALEWQAQTTLAAASALAHWVETTREDRQNWAPTTGESAGTRGVMDMVRECVSANYRLAAILSGGAPKNAAEVTAPANAAEARAALMASANVFAEALRSADESVLSRSFETPRGTMPGTIVASLPAMHMYYHGGQVNLVQLLYGDTEFHRPGQASG